MKALEAVQGCERRRLLQTAHYGAPAVEIQLISTAGQRDIAQLGKLSLQI